jgi:hypothetical protein
MTAVEVCCTIVLVLEEDGTCELDRGVRLDREDEEDERGGRREEEEDKAAALLGMRGVVLVKGVALCWGMVPKLSKLVSYSLSLFSLLSPSHHFLHLLPP